MEAAMDSQPLPQQKDDVNEVQELKDSIIAGKEDPESGSIHAIAVIFEKAACRYMDDTDHGRSAQSVQHLCDLIWGDEEFSELLPSFLLNESSVSVKVATARLFSSCSPWMDVLKNAALHKTSRWVRKEIPGLLADDSYWIPETRRNKDLDSERLCTYYTGLLSASLARGDVKLEMEVLRRKLPPKLMQYLRMKVSDEKSVGAEDITDLVKQAGRAAESGAKAANAHAVAVRATGDDNAEVVETAAFEVYRKTNDEEKYAELRRLAKLREKFCIQCLVILQRHAQVLRLVVRSEGFEVILALLQKSSEDEKASSTIPLLPDVLKLICALMAHEDFAELFVKNDGIQRLLAVRRSDRNFEGLSSCLCIIGPAEAIMERICTLPSNVVDQVVELALQLLECQQDESRSNAALFFAPAFVFRPVINAFDEKHGLQRLLHILHDASVRAGVTPGQLNNPGSLLNEQSPSEVLTTFKRQIASNACTALEQYFSAKLLLLVDSVRPSIGADNEPFDKGDDMDDVLQKIQKDRELGLAFVKDLCPAVDSFLGADGHITMLELCQASLGEGYWYDVPGNVLGVLNIVTLVPDSCKIIVNATLRNGRTGVGVILDAAEEGYAKTGVTVPALKLLTNLVSPPSMSDDLSQLSGTTQSEVREAIRANRGLAILPRLLEPENVGLAICFDRIWALTCRVLLGLAREPTIADFFRKMPLEEKLLKVIQDSGSYAPGGDAKWRQTELGHETTELLGVLLGLGV